MGIKKRSKAVRYRQTFTFEAPESENVSLVGDFNQWNSTTHPMKKTDQGVWKKAVFLEPGIYEYKFVADGVWEMDCQNEECCQNCFGSLNSRIIVPLQK